MTQSPAKSSKLPSFDWADPLLLSSQLSEDERMAYDMAKRFADEELLPGVLEANRNQTFDRAIYRKFGEAGFLGIALEGYGCPGGSAVMYGLVARAVESCDSAYRSAMSVQSSLVMYPIHSYGTEDQKERFLPKLASGEFVGAFGLTEPDHGSDAGGLKTRAKKVDGGYVLNGAKMWISLAEVADHFLVFASLDRSLKHRGLTAFVVERGMPGFTTGTIKGKLGVRAGNTGELAFDNVRVPVENRIGEEGEGFKIAMSCIDQGRFTVGAGAVGLTKACLDASVRYSHERETFGVEIGRHQLVQQMIAKMSLGYETSWLLTAKAAELKNRGIRNTRETSMMKWHACDVALQSADDAIQIHGAYG
ncbi:MAG: acyl-CoA dehydrogenase family protein, partial [Alphaproteobacteria bacterium]|nr:acyl-CoA dehydrogenase family protein [Alphaproteobacteria bacterium]